MEAFDPDTVTDRDDPCIDALEKKVEDTISSIFPHGTHEYRRFKPGLMDIAGYNLWAGTPHYEVIQGLRQSKEREITNLRTIIELFEEKLNDGAETPASNARRAFGDLDLHPEIAQECSTLFEGGHYSQAVETACKVLDMLVQRRSLRNDIGGTDLMRLVFSPKNPILKFNDQTNQSEKSEQEGMMHLYEGAMMALRNPRAHSITQDHPERAVDYLSFISMLAKALDRTQRA